MQKLAMSLLVTSVHTAHVSLEQYGQLLDVMSTCEASQVDGVVLTLLESAAYAVCAFLSGLPRPCITCLMLVIFNELPIKSGMMLGRSNNIYNVHVHRQRAQPARRIISSQFLFPKYFPLLGKQPASGTALATHRERPDFAMVARPGLFEKCLKSADDTRVRVAAYMVYGSAQCAQALDVMLDKNVCFQSFEV